MKTSQYHNRLSTLGMFQAEGEEVFNHLYGSDEEHDVIGAMLGNEEEYSSFQGDAAQIAPGVGSINANDRAISVSVTNSGEATQTVRILDPENNFGVNNYGNGDGITVASATGPYNRLLFAAMNAPFVVRGAVFTFSGTNKADQMRQPLRVRKVDIGGTESTSTYLPHLYRDPKNFASDMIEDRNFYFSSNNKTGIEFELKPGTTVELTLYIQSQSDLGRVSEGHNALKVAKGNTPLASRNVMKVITTR